MGYYGEVIIRKVIHSESYTSNVHKIYELAFEKVKERELVPEYVINHCRDWKWALNEDRFYSLPTLKAMLQVLKEDPKAYSHLNPQNGWGSVEGAIDFLNRLYNAMLVSDDTLLVLSC